MSLGDYRSINVTEQHDTESGKDETRHIPIHSSLHSPSSSEPAYLLRLSSQGDSSTDGGRSDTATAYVFVYGVINAVMAIPALYGYASVIFNHNVFTAHIDALAKLVVWSSAVHQISFSAFSTLPFAIGQVQDAGLIFLSHMANTIANKILDTVDTADAQVSDVVATQIVSTVLVTLSFYTVLTGAVLTLMGKFGLADLVSYLPLPVVGGYLAYIGYFCFQAGVSLCISKSMQGFGDWKFILERQEFLLAAPGLVAGLLLTVVSRRVVNETVLPILMVLIPTSFYIILVLSGMPMEDARRFGWLGETSAPVPITDLLSLVDFSHVHWSLISGCVSTWLGMVFVVSFGSCLDVSAISMDTGKPLNMNAELTTVGVSNMISGLMVGFSGSYIFSQTIFTLRTGCRSRAVGVIVAALEIGVVLSTINVMEVVPLFFLGSTLIFIGIDLLYEWIWEIRHKILLSEYGVVLLTFACIQVFSINTGIVLGIGISIVDYVVKTALVSSVNKVTKRSRAVWRPEQWKLLQSHGYHIQNPKIVTFEVRGTVFFGSSLQLLTQITQDLSLDTNQDDRRAMLMASPGRPMSTPGGSINSRGEFVRRRRERSSQAAGLLPPKRVQPRFVVLDLMQVPSIDSSAARGCFYQLGKICARRNIVLCASGANARVAWVLRSHDAATEVENVHALHDNDKIILFETVYEALEFCESKLISELEPARKVEAPMAKLLPGSLDKISLRVAFVNLLGLNIEEEEKLEAFEREKGPFHEEIEYHSGEAIFEEGLHADAFFVVLSGSVALFRRAVRSQSNPDIFSGAGNVPVRASRLGEVETFIGAGNIFGFVDYVLDQAWLFSAVAARDGTVVCKLNRTGLEILQKESPDLDFIVHKVLLKASILELAGAPGL